MCDILLDNLTWVTGTLGLCSKPGIRWLAQLQDREEQGLKDSQGQMCVSSTFGAFQRKRLLKHLLTTTPSTLLLMFPFIKCACEQ